MKKIFKKILNPFTIFFIFLILGIVLLYTYILNPVPAEVGQVIGSRTFLNSKGELEIRYAYVSGKIDKRISKNVAEVAKKSEVVPIKEEVRARTPNSRTFSTNKEGVKVTEFISGNQYFKDDKANWWQADYKTTTPEEFSKLPKTPLYARLTDTSKFAFVKRALATTDTFYPDASVEVTTVDGYVQNTVGCTSFDLVRSGNGVEAIDYVATGSFYALSSRQMETSCTDPNYMYIIRGIFGFDTSAIPDTDTINSATFSIYGTYKSNLLSQSLVIDRRVPASPTALATSDFNIAGWDGVEQASNRISTTSFVTGAYNDFTLNSTGTGNISKTGVSWLGTRGSGDFDNSAPTWSLAFDAAGGYFADQTGTTQDPKLVVVHSAAPEVPSTTTIIKDGVIFKSGIIFK